MFILGMILGVFYIIIRIALGLESNEKKESNPMIGLSIFAIIAGILSAFGSKK